MVLSYYPHCLSILCFNFWLVLLYEKIYLALSRLTACSTRVSLRTAVPEAAHLRPDTGSAGGPAIRLQLGRNLRSLPKLNAPGRRATMGLVAVTA
jgi:hypothetical protein